MKTMITLGFAGVALSAAHAQEPTRLDEIVQDRGTVLAQIVKAYTNLRKAGTGSEEQVRQATINLYAFRRDSAKTQAERPQWQERIVAAEKEGHAYIKACVKTGTATPMDELLAEERVLAAEQKLWELRLVK